jgi:hypothetical protein
VDELKKSLFQVSGLKFLDNLKPETKETKQNKMESVQTINNDLRLSGMTEA